MSILLYKHLIWKFANSYNQFEELNKCSGFLKGQALPPKLLVLLTEPIINQDIDHWCIFALLRHNELRTTAQDLGEWLEAKPSLTPDCNLKFVIFIDISWRDILSISCEIALRWMARDLGDD